VGGHDEFDEDGLTGLGQRWRAQQAEILKANYIQATANVTGLTAQVAFNAKRHADIELLAAEDANTQFQAQDRKNSYGTMLVSISSYSAYL
jgi:hypothetical protein